MTCRAVGGIQATSGDWKTKDVRSHSSFCFVVAICLFSGLFAPLPVLAQETPDASVPDISATEDAERAARAAYDSLVLRARDGDYAPVLDYLRALGTAATPAQRFDHILISSWAGQTGDVISLYDALPLNLKQTAPVDVYIAVARNLRDLKQWGRALEVWRAGAQIHPQEAARFAPGLIMTLADSGQMEEANRAAQDWLTRAPNNEEVKDADIYLKAVEARLKAEAEERARQEERARYDALIVAARGGNVAPALNYLRGLGSAATPAQKFDHILVASWAELYDEVARGWQALTPELKQTAPAEAQQAVARALRNLKNLPQSLVLSRGGMLQHPQQAIGFVPVLVMDLADLGQLDEAIKIGLKFLQSHPQDADLRMAVAYVYTLQEKHFEALFHADKAIVIAPQRAWIEDEYIRILNRAGLSEQALERARKTGRFSGAALRGLEADDAARRTRLAAMPTRSETERFVIADRALARYDELLTAWRALGQEAAADVTRIRIDRLAAFHARVRMDDLVREYEALKREGATIPTWALSNVASAYLYLRQPEIARDLYRKVLSDLDANTPAADKEKLGPKNARLSNEIGLMYALSEAEQFAEMKPVLKRIEAYTPVFLYHKGSALPDGNLEYLSSRQALIAADLAMDNTPAAQRKLEALVREAPNNTDLLTDLASVTRVRAMPRKAEQYYKLAETLDPRDSDIELGQALVALDLQEWRQVEELTQDVVSRYPENQTVRRLARLWQVHNMAEFRISTSHALGTRFNKRDTTSANASDSGDFGLDAVLYSPPIHYNWRAFIGGSHAQGKFSEGKGHYSTLRTGLEWRSRDLTLEGEVYAGRAGAATGTKVGARLAGAYDFNDHWQISGSLDYLSRATPVRALRAGIRSNAANVSLLARLNDRHQWTVGVTGTHFSDGNDRWLVDFAGVDRLYTTPNMQLDMLVSVSSQHNSEDADRPYFNPKRDLMVLPAVRATHRLYRRYENVWEHFLTLSAGKYRQEGYGTSGVWGITYGQRYRYNDVFEIGATLDALSRTYDGRREGRLNLAVDMVTRF